MYHQKLFDCHIDKFLSNIESQKKMELALSSANSFFDQNPQYSVIQMQYLYDDKTRLIKYLCVFYFCK